MVDRDLRARFSKHIERSEQMYLGARFHIGSAIPIAPRGRDPPAAFSALRKNILPPCSSITELPDMQRNILPVHFFIP